MALELSTRKWVASASSRPPPRAREEIAEMVGMGRVEREVKVVRRVKRNAAVLCVVNEGQSVSYECEAIVWQVSQTYSSWVNVLRSFRSAPAQNELSTADARISARVGPLSLSPAIPPNFFCHDGVGISSPVASSYCAWTASISSRRDDSSAREMALRAAGRFSSKMRIWPEPGAGSSVTRRTGSASDE